MTLMTGLGRGILLGVAVAMLSGAPAIAGGAGSRVEVADSLRQIGVGDAERRPILDALRGPVEEDLGQPVKFVVSQLFEFDGWAFFVGRPQTPDGAAIDFEETRYADLIADGIFDGDTTYALLRKEGRRWTYVTHVIGPTDVAYAGWPEEYGAPSALFGF